MIIWTFITSISIVRYNGMVTYTVEIVGDRHRSTFGLMINNYYALGFMILSLAGYISRDWINLMKIAIL